MNSFWVQGEIDKHRESLPPELAEILDMVVRALGALEDDKADKEESY